MNELVYLTGATGEIRTARGQLVVPVVAIKEGVIHAVNSPVPELVPYATLLADPAAWNGKPALLNHPTSGGRQLSADDPAIVESSGLGTIHRARVEDRRLLMDVHVDEAKAERVGAGHLLERLRAGERCEVSIGAFVRTLPKQGVFNGKPYSAVWTSLSPDHLALLERGVGACSCQAGCGTYQRAAETYVPVDAYGPALAQLRGVRNPEADFTVRYRQQRLAEFEAEYAAAGGMQ